MSNTGDIRNMVLEMRLMEILILINDIIGVAIRCGQMGQCLYVSKNGVWQDSGDPTSSGATVEQALYQIQLWQVQLIGSVLSGTQTFLHCSSYDTDVLSVVNFGNGYFATTAVQVQQKQMMQESDSY